MSDPEYRKRGAAFQDEDVVRAYAHRPDYPPALFEALLARIPGRHLALDLGTGPGKIAGRLAPHFKRVDALDPSAAMLDAARKNWPAKNINWICARAEDAQLAPAYDLITAGAAIHWMAPELTFPKIARHLAPGARLAIIGGSVGGALGAREAPWKDEWKAFADRWMPQDGSAYDRSRQGAVRTLVLRWLDIDERLSFDHEVRQTIPEFLDNQHSHSIWARARLGAKTMDFDDEATALLTPFASEGVLTYTVATRLTLGNPRTTPKEAVNE
ncbi:MAG TPA: class I SAM-dependent methyltransferase [Alphaproteobacteria bacterium]|nr:class I SAM-dependent methyltransferase [Alphaproteobacteria bacterium]